MAATKRTPEQLLRNVFPPMLATLAGAAPEDDAGWSYELKYDGFRAVVALVNGELAMWSRNELDLAPRFPKIAQQLAKLKLDDVVLDGEIVATDAKGVPRFQLLQSGTERELFFVFDLLWLGGRDLRRVPYEERRALLEKALKKPPAHIALAQRMGASGSQALADAAAAGWEGIIAKRNASTYEPRRSKEWLKVKALHGQELAIIGWNPSTHSPREIGSLHLAFRDGDGRWRYAGKVGTGFSAKLRVWFRDELQKDVVAKPVADDAPRVRAATWVRPRFVAQIAFTEWTDDNRLRHPSFLGLRDDKKPEDVVRETPTASAAEPKKKTTSKKAPIRRSAAADAKAAMLGPNARAAGAKASTPAGRSSPPKSSSSPPKSSTAKSTAKSSTAKASTAKATSRRTKSAKPPAAREPGPVTLTHPERVLYPKDKLTKQDVADYYAAVAPAMITTLDDRPLALEHWNQGIHAGSWFHQNVGKEAPAWVTTIDTPTRTVSRKSVRHLVVDRPETLQWLAQMSVLTTHMWSARGAALDHPDWLVFDLDPAKGKGIEQAIDAAIIMRGLLENLEMPSFPKTSGKRGIHIFIPLAPGQTHEEVVAFATSISAAVANEVPDITVDRALGQRHGRLYLDALQNGYGKTMVAPYSLRAIDGAPVSAPLRWDEITKKLDPKKFNLRTMPDRLAKLGDLFAGVLSGGVRLPKLE
jgi:bifunctional non-homologous end joining protein LigD